MRRRLLTISVFLLVLALVVAGVAGCSRAAEERKAQNLEPVTTPQPGVPTSSGGATLAPVETVVSAVTPGAEEVPTQPVTISTPIAVGPTATTAPGVATAVPLPSAAPPPSQQGTAVWHTVQQGETLSAIAQRYGTSWQAVAQANGVVNPNQIYVGQRLKIPSASGTSGGTTTTGCRIRHSVKSGEWVWQIARNYGVSPYDILAANGLSVATANLIYPGKVLCIP